MKDRSVQYPKRYRMTKIPGTDDIYDLDPAPGEITEEGTLINKGTLLSDDTAAKFFESLVGTETVDQVLGWIGNYNLHWWRRRTAANSYVENRPTTGTYTIWYSIIGTATLNYSDSISISDTGVVSLVNPSIKSISSYNTEMNFLLGKYFKGTGQSCNMNGTPASDANTIYYMPETSSIQFDTWDNPYAIIAKDAQPVGSVFQTTVGDWEYLQSHDRDTYPDSGESDGYEYQYLGKPLDNAVTAPNIATGEYTGTGTYGSANPNTLTFDFEPKLVIILWDDYRMIGSFLGIYIHGTNYMTSGLGTYSSNGANPVSTNGMSISWYGDDADRQFNRSNTIYKYIALG